MGSSKVHGAASAPAAQIMDVSVMPALRMVGHGIIRGRIIGLQRDHPLALRQSQPPERHHALAAHGFSDSASASRSGIDDSFKPAVAANFRRIEYRPDLPYTPGS